MLNHEQITRRILQKMDCRRRLGWVDYSSGSYDWIVASARAHRIVQRARMGRRMTLAAAMWS